MTSLNYFAIGSMINPVSFRARGLKGTECQPAELLDHKIVFQGRSGMASIKDSVGESLHGVIWLCDDTDMEKLDEIESVYDRITATARLYNGKHIECVVYKFNETRLEERRMKVADEDGDPSERYLEIMIEGCIHHRVKSSYIDWLKAHPRKSRTPEDQWKSYAEAPVGVTMTAKELAIHNGKDGNRLCYAFNGKVCEVAEGCPPNVIHIMAGGNPDVAFFCAKIFYDPKYGDPATPVAMDDEHRRCMEDYMLFLFGDEINGLTQVIATLI